MRKLIPLVVLMLVLAGCSKTNEQQPSDAEQKQMQQEHDKAMEQQRQLTSGEGNSMLRDEPQPNQGKTQQQSQPNQKRSQQKSKQQPNPSQQ